MSLLCFYILVPNIPIDGAYSNYNTVQITLQFQNANNFSGVSTAQQNEVNVDPFLYTLV